MAEPLLPLTDPAREMADLLTALVSGDRNLTGDRHLAAKFDVEPWSQEFYRILATIMDRLHVLKGIVQDLPLDDDYREEMVGHLNDIALAFAPGSFQNHWTQSGADKLRPFFPKSHGRPRVDDRRVLSGIIFVNRNGLRWRDAPKDYGPAKTLYNRWKRWGEKGVFVRMMEGLSETRALGASGIADLLPKGSDVYVTIDVDALDMSLVPGSVSGEPDGMTFPQLMDALEAIAVRHRVRGFDFVEVNPPLDVGTGATAYLGALVVTGFLGFVCNQPWWAEMRDAKGGCR